jgi:hypothetical protein
MSGADDRDWCEDYSEIVRLYRWLQASDEHALPLEGVIDFLEKPWNWTPERDLMLAEEKAMLTAKVAE